MSNLAIHAENLDQKAYQIIKTMIEERQLLPGEKISQEKLAKDLGISRTPLIAALKFLEQEKLIEARPRRGFYVRLFSMEEMISIFEIREVLEGLSARRAAESITKKQAIKLLDIFAPFSDTQNIDYPAYSKADRKFHNFIAEIASREFLSSILRTFNIISLAYQYPTSEGLVRKPSETLVDHINIVEAICHHDSNAAEQLMRSHLQKAISELKANLKS